MNQKKIKVGNESINKIKRPICRPKINDSSGLHFSFPKFFNFLVFGHRLTLCCRPHPRDCLHLSTNGHIDPSFQLKNQLLSASRDGLGMTKKQPDHFNLTEMAEEMTEDCFFFCEIMNRYNLKQHKTRTHLSMDLYMYIYIYIYVYTLSYASISIYISSHHLTSIREKPRVRSREGSAVQFGRILWHLPSSRVQLPATEGWMYPFSLEPVDMDVSLPPIIMEVKNWCISNSSYLSNIAIFHFHDYERKGT